MFKMIGRILIILLVIALVTGGLYALVQSSSANPSVAAFGPGFESQRTGQRQAPTGGFRDHGDRDGEGEFSLGRGLGGVFGTLLKMGLVTLLVLLIQKILVKSHRQIKVGSA